MGCSASDQNHFSLKRAKDVKYQQYQPPPRYDVNIYTQTLTAAIANKDDLTVIAYLQHCPPAARSGLKDKYVEVNTGRSLLDDCRNKLAVTSAFTAELLLLDRPEVTSRLLYTCLQAEQPETTQSLVIELICLYPESLMSNLNTAYKDHQGEPLIKAIQRSKVISAEVKWILEFVLQSDRVTDLTTSNEEAMQYLIDNAMKRDFFAQYGPFLITIEYKGLKDLQEIFELYLQTVQRSLTVEAEKAFPQGTTRDGLVLFVNTVRTPWLHLADRVHQLICSDKALLQMALLYYILTLDKDELSELKKMYLSRHFETLINDVRTVVKDDVIKQTLIKALR